MFKYLNRRALSVKVSFILQIKGFFIILYIILILLVNSLRLESPEFLTRDNDIPVKRDMLFLVFRLNNHIILWVKLDSIFRHPLESENEIIISEVENNTRNVGLVMLIDYKIKNKKVYSLIPILSVISFDQDRLYKSFCFDIKKFYK